MESPEGWSLLTSSLAVSTLSNISRTWAFLVVQGLVRDDAGDREAFASFVREVADQGEITGPSQAHRVASRIVGAGIHLQLSERPDPHGERAKDRIDLVQEWQKA